MNIFKFYFIFDFKSILEMCYVFVMGLIIVVYRIVCVMLMDYMVC